MKRTAFTLVELLLVVVILAILLVIAIPFVLLTGQGRDQREASRILTALILKAQAQAAETQRPCGIWIERRANNPREAFDVFLCYSPANYAGDTEGATCQVDGGGAPFVLTTPTWVLPPGSLGFESPPVPGPPIVSSGTSYGTPQVGTATFGADGQLVPVVVQAGDKIRFGNKGAWRRITAVNPGPPAQIMFTHDAAAPQPSGVFTFEITRQPEKSGKADTLPATTCIDLSVSGSGYNPTAFSSAVTSPIVVMFDAKGDFQTAYWSGQDKRNEATQGIHFLIGLSEKVDVANPGDPAANLNDGEAIWVTITTRAGEVRTSENNPWSNSLTPADALSAKISSARQFVTH